MFKSCESYRQNCCYITFLFLKIKFFLNESKRIFRKWLGFFNSTQDKSIFGKRNLKLVLFSMKRYKNF